MGNHTYTHANLAVIPAKQVQIELNATQRLIESITGRSTTLFRPPYNADSQPDRPRRTGAAQAGAGRSRLSRSCWRTSIRRIGRGPGADVIVERIKELRQEGSLILLHDAGGNRQQTVEALPQIIDWLQTRGDQHRPLSELLKSRAMT